MAEREPVPVTPCSAKGERGCVFPVYRDGMCRAHWILFREPPRYSAGNSLSEPVHRESAGKVHVMGE